MSALQSFIESNRERFLSQLTSFVRIPSISTDPAYQEHVLEAAAFVVERCTSLGLRTSLVETPGHPVVLARGPEVPGAPRVLLYGHYDVQPAEDLELWDSPPFEPRVEGERLYGRGACDNKGQLMAHLCALESLRAVTGMLPVNLTILVEGEEEVGSPNFASVLREHRESLTADVAVISDTSTPVPGTPAVHYSLRGIVILEVRLQVAARDVHSGIYGGTTPNAVGTLMRLCAALHDEGQRVTVPGFYDRVREMEDWERQNLERIPFDEPSYLAWIGATQAVGERGYSTNERRWFRPTLEFHGVWGGYQGRGAKTIVPAEAGVKLSARLVPDQDPDAILASLTSWFLEHCPPWARLEFSGGFKGAPYLLERRGDKQRLFLAADAAVARAFGVAPLFCRHGGAIAVVSQIRDILGVDTLLVGLGNPDDAVHSPNEKFELASFYRGIRMAAELFSELAGADTV